MFGVARHADAALLLHAPSDHRARGRRALVDETTERCREGRGVEIEVCEHEAAPLLDPHRQKPLGDGVEIVGNRAAVERCERLGFRKPLALIPQYGFDVGPQTPAAIAHPSAQRARFVELTAGEIRRWNSGKD